MYEILEKKIGMASGGLYKEYCKLVSKPVVTRPYRNYMKNGISWAGECGGKGRWKVYRISV